MRGILVDISNNNWEEYSAYTN